VKDLGRDRATASSWLPKKKKQIGTRRRLKLRSRDLARQPRRAARDFSRETWLTKAAALLRVQRGVWVAVGLFGSREGSVGYPASPVRGQPRLEEGTHPGLGRPAKSQQDRRGGGARLFRRGGSACSVSVARRAPGGPQPVDDCVENEEKGNAPLGGGSEVPRRSSGRRG